MCSSRSVTQHRTFSKSLDHQLEHDDFPPLEAGLALGRTDEKETLLTWPIR